MDMLDMINNFSVENNYPMSIFLCKIINQFKGGHVHTTKFNKAVADSVAVGIGDKIEIIMIDMKNGAGLDYSDDPLDPNVKFACLLRKKIMWGISSSKNETTKSTNYRRRMAHPVGYY